MDIIALQENIKREADRLKAEGMEPEAAWLRAIETEFRKAQIRKGAALVERAIWEGQMRGWAN